MAALMTLSCAWAQKISKNEAKSLQTFLSQNAAKGGNNAEALRMVGSNVAACPGIKVEKDTSLKSISRARISLELLICLVSRLCRRLMSPATRSPV